MKILTKSNNMNATLYDKKSNLVLEKMKMDKFFSLFLDKFGGKMDPSKPDTPIWKLYKVKLNEYESLSQEIRNTEYWISKERHV